MDQKMYEVTSEFVVKFEIVRVRRNALYNDDDGIPQVHVGHKACSKGETIKKGERVYLTESQAVLYKSNVKGETP